MEQNNKIWQRIPAGIAGLLALILILYNDSRVATIFAFGLIVVEFVLGFEKRKLHDLLNKTANTAGNRVSELEAGLQQSQQNMHSLQLIGRSNLPVWAHQVEDCIGISTTQINDISQRFSVIVDDLNAIVNGNANDDELSIDEIKQRLGNISSSLVQLVEMREALQQEINELSVFVEKLEPMARDVGSIAEQTNLLALNAAIEAARAGESDVDFLSLLMKCVTLLIALVKSLQISLKM